MVDLVGYLHSLITKNTRANVLYCSDAISSYDALNNTPCLLPTGISKVSAQQVRLYLWQLLNFDYSKQSPVAYVPIMSCADVGVGVGKELDDGVVAVSGWDVGEDLMFLGFCGYFDMLCGGSLGKGDTAAKQTERDAVVDDDYSDEELDADELERRIWRGTRCVLKGEFFLAGIMNKINQRTRVLNDHIVLNVLSISSSSSV
ncbi:hypothetical protein RIF29_40535 [Crotalaria pallida]|uniref:Uncharacterized protein n=1 Tax=Crotalaria pallida TaxID=3830 RepID=A0AAN9HQS3_CROPI